MHTINKMNRFQAFSWHIFASVCIATLCAALVFLVWYPTPIAGASGVTDIFLLVLGVDISLGPLITLIIFNPQKKGLKRDMVIVLTLQLAALLYGVYTVFVARPAYIVFNADRFDLVYANDFSPEQLDKLKHSRFKSLPLFGPKIIAALKPVDPDALTDLIFSALSGGPDLAQSPEYYVLYAELKPNAIKQAQPLTALKEFNPPDVFAALEKKYAAIKDELGFLPLKGKRKDLTVLIRRDSGTIVELIDAQPWK